MVGSYLVSLDIEPTPVNARNFFKQQDETHKEEPILPKSVGAAASMFGGQLKPTNGSVPSWKKNAPTPMESGKLKIISSTDKLDIRVDFNREFRRNESQFVLGDVVGQHEFKLQPLRS